MSLEHLRDSFSLIIDAFSVLTFDILHSVCLPCPLRYRVTFNGALWAILVAILSY